MTECKFCDKDFDSKQELHIHWGEEHEDELNSHQEEKVKKAQRKKEENKEAKTQKRRNFLLKGLTGVTLVVFAVITVPQIMSMFQSSPFQLDQQPMMGDENASVTVVEFGDYQCSHCKTFDSEVKPQLKNEYIDSGEVKFYYINFPVINENSELAARAGEYVKANDPENFWDFHSELFSISGPLTQELIASTANKTTNISEEEIEEGLTSEEANSNVNTDKEVANKNGVKRTPTVYVNGERTGNSYEEIKSAVESNLENEN